MRVLFLNGPSQDCCDRFFGWPTSLLYAISPTVQAVRDGSLSLELAPAIFDPVWYVEGENDVEVKAEFAEAAEGADVVCASCTYDSLYPTLQLLAEAKRLNPGVVTVLGGPHFDEAHGIASLNDVRRRPDLIDFGVAGDGEWVLRALLSALAQGRPVSLEDVPGRATLYSRRGMATTAGTPVDLDSVPFFPADLADVSRHRNDFDIFHEDGRILSTIQMIAKRGCAYNCNFCSERRDLAYPNARSIDNILTEIDLRRCQGFEAVFFDDSTFGTYPRLRELLRELAGTGMVFGCLNRFNHLTNPGLVAAYRDAGFRYFYCAIEQFEDGALKLMGKGQDTELISRSMQVLHDHGMMLGVSLLYGLPYETRTSVLSTIDFTAEWVDAGLIRLVSESVLSYHPGTPAARNQRLCFDRSPPNQGYPFNQFEEGQWEHPPHVTADYLEWILRLSEARYGPVMVRNRHSWYAREGYVQTLESAQFCPV